jgi:secondary thiamine-phosphate synthase enzyme
MRPVPLRHELTYLKVWHRSLRIETQACLQFIDLTDQIRDTVHQSAILDGIVNVQTLHTTTAILINENEPCLIEDLKALLESFAPRHGSYRHNDFTVRNQNLLPGEDQNGHSHCKAALLKTSETLNLLKGNIQLGTWQRIFLVELDKARLRTVSVAIVGSCSRGTPHSARCLAFGR